MDPAKALLRFSPVVLWLVAVVLWPVPANVRMGQDAEMHATNDREGLYKSEITQAGFGLLGARFYESIGTKKSWMVRSEFAELHHQKENYAFMKNVTADFFAALSGNVVHTQSDYGRCHFGRHLMELEGNVAVTSKQGYRFTMKKLDYHSNIQKFRSSEMVQMRGPNPDKPDMLLTGLGLDADLTKESFVVRRNTQSRRRLSNREWIHIQSTRGEFRTQSQQAVFSDRVKASLPSLTIESDQLEMSMSGKGELLRAKGNVVLFHKDRKGRSESADIEIANEKIVLEGHAVIEGQDTELKGRKITLHTDEDRVEVEQAEGTL